MIKKIGDKKMISIRYNHETEEFQVKGTVNLGIIGTFENKEYGEGNIHIDNALWEFVNEADYNQSPKLTGKLYYCLKDGQRDGDSIATILQNYYNEKLEELEKNIKQFNDLIWSQMFDWFLAVGFEFWEDERMLEPQYRGRDWSEEVEHVYTEKQHEIYEMLQAYKLGSPNNGTVQKPDIEKIMREYLYMFNFDGLIQNINRKYLRFYFDLIEFEFEDNWDASIFCSTVGSLSGDFSLKEWNNF